MHNALNIADEVMTTDEVMAYLNYTNPRGVSAWCGRYGVKPIYKLPGHKGKNVYARKAIEAGKKRMTGQGAGGGRPIKGRSSG